MKAENSGLHRFRILYIGDEILRAQALKFAVAPAVQKSKVITVFEYKA
jgi:hypothetical protein